MAPFIADNRFKSANRCNTTADQRISSQNPFLFLHFYVHFSVHDNKIRCIGYDEKERTEDPAINSVISNILCNNTRFTSYCKQMSLQIRI